MDKGELVRLYFDKDIVEKAFRSLKGVIKLQPIRHWLSQRVIAHVFICYLAYLLLSLLKFRLKSLGISPEDALEELKTMVAKVRFAITHEETRFQLNGALLKIQPNKIEMVATDGHRGPNPSHQGSFS